MFKERLFVRVSFVMVAGLTLFVALVTLFWHQVFDARYHAAMQELTTNVSLLLLPDIDATDAAHGAALAHLADSLSVDITLYSDDGRLIAAGGAPAPFNRPAGEPGTWEPIPESPLWMNVFPDGRIIIADLTHLGVPDDSYAVTIVFILLTIVIAALMYPVIRRITRRLERLQREVETVGAGDLSARVTVDGKDEIAKLAVSFNRSTATIEDLVNRQRMLLANASHELRSPLARIRMGIELLDTKDTAKRRSDLRKDIGELDALIDDLITMTRFDAEAADEGFEMVDLMAIAAEECSRTEDCAVKGDGADVWGDRRMLQHMVRNLLDNAQKYGRPPIEIGIEKLPDRAVLTVTDNGPGIRAEEHHKVFEPFFRGAGQQNIAGSGLGLPLVARIATAHNAIVEVRNQPKSAISVTFTLPATGSV